MDKRGETDSIKVIRAMIARARAALKGRSDAAIDGVPANKNRPPRPAPKTDEPTDR